MHHNWLGLCWFCFVVFSVDKYFIITQSCEFIYELEFVEIQIIIDEEVGWGEDIYFWSINVNTVWLAIIWITNSHNIFSVRSGMIQPPQLIILCFEPSEDIIRLELVMIWYKKSLPRWSHESSRLKCLSRVV